MSLCPLLDRRAGGAGSSGHDRGERVATGVFQAMLGQVLCAAATLPQADASPGVSRQPEGFRRSGQGRRPILKDCT